MRYSRTHGTICGRNVGLERSKEKEVGCFKFEMGCLRSMCGLMLWNRVRNEVSRRVQVERQLSSKVDQCVLRWIDMWREWLRSVWPRR